MAACAGSHHDETIHSGFQRLPRMAYADDIVQDDAPVAMHRVEDLLYRCLQAGDEDRHFVIDADAHVTFQPGIRLVHDLIDRERPDGLARVSRSEGAQFLGDAGQPFVEQLRVACVERRKGADDARLALCENQFRIADDEHGRGHHGQRQILQD